MPEKKPVGCARPTGGVVGEEKAPEKDRPRPGGQGGEEDGAGR